MPYTAPRFRHAPWWDTFALLRTGAAACLGAALLVAAFASTALAAPIIDNNDGIWSDSYDDTLGVSSATNVVNDPLLGIMRLAAGQVTGNYETVIIRPPSFDAWGSLTIDGDFDLTNLTIEILDPLNSDAVILGPTVMPTGGISLTSLIATTYPELKVRLNLTQTTTAPTVEQLQVTWNAVSVLLLEKDAVTTRAAGVVVVHEISLSVSFVEARGLVVYDTLPHTDVGTVTYPYDYGQDDNPTFESATNGGQYSAAGLVVSGVTVPPNSVYWDLGTIPEGTTTILRMNIDSKNGTLNGTVYENTVRAEASNAVAAASNTVTTTITSSPRPGVSKRAFDVVNIGGTNFVPQGNVITYQISDPPGFIDGNDFAPVDRETMVDSVVWDDVSAMMPFIQGSDCSAFTVLSPADIPNISSEGVCIENYAPPDGSPVLPFAIVWTMHGAANDGVFPPGQTFDGRYRVTVETAPAVMDGDVIDNVACLHSRFTATICDPEQVTIGVDETPQGIYAKGDNLLGSRTANFSFNDDASFRVETGDEFAYLLRTINNGAVALNEIVHIDMVPEEVTYVPGSATVVQLTPSTANANLTVFYSTEPISPTVVPNEPIPPPFDYTQAPADLDVPGNNFWTTVEPANPADVHWVAFHVPVLDAAQCAIVGSCTSPTTPVNNLWLEFRVTANDPFLACEDRVINNYGLFNAFEFTSLAGVQQPVPGGSLSTFDREPTIQVVPRPFFQISAALVTIDPDPVEAPAQITYTLRVANNSVLGTRTEDVEVELRWFGLPINGVQTLQTYVGSTGGSLVSLNPSAGTVTRNIGGLDPGESKFVTLQLLIPGGAPNLTPYRIQARMEGQGPNADCEPVVAFLNRNGIVISQPELQLIKQDVPDEIAPGSELDYALSFNNVGSAPSTGTWIVDRVPPEMVFVEAFGPNVRFSDALPPDLPGTLDIATPLDAAAIAAEFTAGIPGGDGGTPADPYDDPWTSPFGEDTTWVAWLVDDPRITPALLPVDATLREVGFRVRNDEDRTATQQDSPAGTVIFNEAAIFSNELLFAIANEVVTTIEEEPAIQLTKQGPQPPTVTSGDEVLWRIAWANTGGSNASQVILRDLLPPELFFVSATHEWNTTAITNGATPAGPVPIAPVAAVVNPDGSTALDFSIQPPLRGGDVQPQEGGTLTIRAGVRPGIPSGTLIRNVACGVLTNPDGTRQTCDDATVSVLNPDLFLRKLVNQTVVLPGETLTYLLVLSNEGPAPAHNVVLTDNLPPSLTYIPGSARIDSSPPGYFIGQPNVSTAPGGGQVLTWSNAFANPLTDSTLIPPSPGTLRGNSGQIVIAFEARVAPSTPAGSILPCAAVVTTDTPESPPPGFETEFPNQDATEVIVPDVVRLQIAKVASNPNPAAGQQIVYEVQVTNPSASDATDVVVTETLPAGFLHVADSGNCTVNGQVLVCRPAGTAPDYILPGQSTVSFLVLAQLDPALGPGIYICSSCVGASNSEPSEVCDDAPVWVQAISDLRVRKFGKMDGQVRAGDVLTYTVIVDNLGPSFARDVAIKDLLQSSENFDVIDIQSDRDAFCSGDPGPPADTPVPATDWPIVDAPPAFGVLPPTGVADVQQRLEVDCTLSDGDDPNTPENEATLAVLAADGPPNSGRWILTMRVRAAQTQDLDNVASVLTSSIDPDASNDEAYVEHEITDTADLALTKSVVGEVQRIGLPGLVFDISNPGIPFPQAPNYLTSVAEVTAGRRLLYTLTVTNNGPSHSENVLVTDRLPAGATLIPGSLTLSQGSCQTGTPGEALDRLQCGLGTLPLGETATITFQMLVDPSVPAGAVLENDAFVSADIFDPDNADNHVFVQSTVNTWADMSIAKTSVGENKTGWDPVLRRFILQDLPGQVTAGHDLRFEISVQNNGPSDAQNVQVIDVLFTSFQLQRVVGASCRPDDVNSTLLVCDIGDVPAGGRHTFDIYVRMDPSYEFPTITNQALVMWGEATPPDQPPPLPIGDLPALPPTLPVTDDPFLNNNSDSEVVEVNTVADVFVTKVDVPAEPRLDRPFEPDDALAGDEHRYRITFGNMGWSVARDVVVTDLLDLKQAGPGILGETFVRCEPIDPDDVVACSFDGVRTVSVDALQVANDPILPGDLNVGESHSFYLVTRVDPGYVLDADDLIAENTAMVASSTTDFHLENNSDTELTHMIAEADLALVKVDDAAGFATCDPVAPGGLITYDLTVTNEGPSDAADVYVIDQLPSDGNLILDPALVEVDVDAGVVVEIRDDGRITVRVGNDPNNEGIPELGRLNAGSSARITIRVRVAESATCGATIQNTARVETRTNDAAWPPAPEFAPGVGGGPRTPTYDPNAANNVATEGTTVECPAVTVRKTVSFDGTCPGIDLPQVWNRTGQPVTFCFEITNSGTTWLDSIRVTDTLRTRTTMPTIIFTDTITSGADPGLPVAPGETVLRQVTIPHVSKACGTADDTVEVRATPVNSGRTLLPCLGAVEASDNARIAIPCAGVDVRVQLPVLGGDTCETWIQVQNVGKKETKALLVAWGEPGFCPPQSAGPLKTECSGLIRPGSAWSFATGQIPNGARSAIVYSLNASDRIRNERGNQLPFADAVCDAIFQLAVGSHIEWLQFDEAYRYQDVFGGPIGPSGDQLRLDFAAHPGEPLAVSVNRTCMDTDAGVAMSAAYTGISSDMEGAIDPRYGGYGYYAPLIFADRNDLNTWLYVQNSGIECTSLEFWFKAQDNCLRPILGDVLALAPGETLHFDPSTVIGPDWLGTAWIRSTQPLGIVVDTMGDNHFSSYAGVFADVFDLSLSLGNQINYAPLVYSEYQGWDSAIQVQNLSATVNAKVKVYFLDRSGDVITTLVDWICPRGSQTFFLPVIAALPGNWTGSARVESQEWWSPGQPLVDPPKVVSVVLLDRWADPARTVRREAVAYNAQTECLLYDWQIATGTKGGLTSGSAVFAIPMVAKGNRGITSEIGITNLVPKPGFTDFAIFLYDQNGLLDYVCQKLSEKQVEYIDLNTWGAVPPGFLGSMVVSAVFWEHPVFDDEGGFERNLVGLGGVAVERVGATLGDEDVPGDESKAFEAFPVFDHFQQEELPNCPGVPRELRP